MALLPENSHDSTGVEPFGELEPVPAGDYKVIIIDSEMIETKDKSNDFEYLNVTMQIISGEYKGQCFFAMFNLINSEKAMKIANRQFAGLKQAIGITVCRDSVKLHDKPFMAKVKYVPENEKQGWKAKNEVRSYKKIEADEEEDLDDHIIEGEFEDDDEPEVIEQPKKKKKKKKKKATKKTKPVVEEDEEDEEDEENEEEDFDGPDWDQ